MGNTTAYQYHITLFAPIGEKTGTLFAKIHGTEIQGVISLMEHENPFSGTVDKAGNCEISGSLQTLLQKVAYQGKGFLDEKEVTLCLEMEKRMLLLTGTAMSFGGDDI